MPQERDNQPRPNSAEQFLCAPPPEPIEPEISPLDADRLRRLVSARARRQMEALRLYEPLPEQQRFHACTIQQRLVRKGNRSGGSLCGAIEFARAALGVDPFDKFPTNRPLLLYVIGYGISHIGRVFHRLLFRPNAFKIIRDQETGLWRAYRPWDAADAKRADDVKPAPPLIAPRFVKRDSFAWIDKREKAFSAVELANGTIIRAFSSGSDPSIAQGDPVDVIWFDEDLENTGWVPEMQARLSDTKGRMWWTAYPHSTNEALITLAERAEQEANTDSPGVAEFRLSFTGNPHIDDEEKRNRRKDFSYLSEEEWVARDRGEFATESFLMYAAFNMLVHGTPQHLEGAAHDNPLDAALRNRGSIPPDWTRYLAIDPGNRICATLFLAVPPPSVGDFAVAYDELYLTNCSAQKLAEHLSHRVGGQTFQAFIIDDHGSRITEAGTGVRVREQYSDAFRAARIESLETKHGFISGSEDREGRATRVRQWLQARDDGTIKFRVLFGTCPNMAMEFAKYRRQRIKRKDGGHIVLDVSEPRSPYSHLMNCLEYLAAYNPTWQEPPKRENPGSPAWIAYQQLLTQDKERRRKTLGGSKMLLGPLS